MAFHRALELAQAIKDKNIAAPIILGGPHVTSNYKHAMSYPAFDYGVLREGELTLWELCEALAGGTPPGQVDGIVYHGPGGLIKTSTRTYIEDLDILPFPAYDLIPDIEVYFPPLHKCRALPVINILSSRGCPNQCTFCDKNVFGSAYRQRSAENVFEEIKMLRETYGVREINFSDDTFLLDKRRNIRLFELLRQAGIFIHWTCYSRIADVDKEYLRFLKDNGL